MEGLLSDLYTTTLYGFWGNHIGRQVPPIFFEKGVRVDSKTYLKGVLEKELLPPGKNSFGNRTWTYQQDPTPAHKSEVVQDWCGTHFPDDDWPPNSPVPNPLDHSVRSVLETKACSTKHRSLDAPRATPVEAWEDWSEGYLRAAVDASPRRISACIRAKGGHFQI
ncbi:unnamed protein product [Haemonchus placei]|uniref:DDE_3 domain-containing protein n=1 Tax=Haemonchus placei TaxID=6290 RepID=A0A0N4W7N6_HAEPC|nr:unnamed protein product [Haemonchus placei]